MGSLAAGWQSSLALVPAGSWFATFQSLGATGVGIPLIGSGGAAIGTLAPLAAKLGWCNGCKTRNLQGTNVKSETICEYESSHSQTLSIMIHSKTN